MSVTASPAGRMPRIACLALAACLAVAPHARAGAAAPPRKGAAGMVTGLPVPRCASLKVSRVNLRRGPGTRYPIEWVLFRRMMPVTILRDFFAWRQVRLFDGTEGWVHAPLLSGTRSFVVVGATRPLRRAPDRKAAAVALLRPGVTGRLLACPPGGRWCLARTGRYRGYLAREGIAGCFAGGAAGG